MASDKDVVIVAAARTPFGRFGGSLRDIDYYELGAIPMREVVKRAGVKANVINEVFWGVGDTSACRDPYTPVAARQSLIRAGLPHETVSISFDMACVSAMHAVKLAAMEMAAGEIEVAIAGGATSFGQSPMVVRGLRFNGFRMGDVKMEDPLYALGYKDFNPVSVDSDNVAHEYGFTRKDLDEWALRSHQNYGKAWNAGKFKDEIMPLPIPQPKGDPKVLDIDEQYRPDTSIEGLTKLKSVYNTRMITAGNAPGLNDGATAILLMTRKRAKELGLKVLGVVVASTSIAINASRMPEGPGYAMLKALQKANLTWDDMAYMEINEAFACVPLVSMKVAAEGDDKKYKTLFDKMNPNGSAIAIGHPNTASGARIIMNLMYELRRRGGGYAMGSLCGGLAQADACIVKVE
ncbi:MAG: acetyl-CoA acetyltransferase [Chloroflexi bacterium RBG_16_50_11]|nr:MAG: acetyl-CoA acetyltransferase [Chloroflexi bacterium RBG_16_50_11]